MKFSIFFIFCLPFFLIPLKSVGQKKWTLDNCIQYAIKNNLSIKSNKLTTSIYKENLAQAKRNFLPSFGLNSSYSTRYGRYIDSNTNGIINTKSSSNSYSTGTSIRLFNGFRLWNQIRFQKILLVINKEGVLEAKHTLAFDVMQAFYDIKFKEGLLKITKEQQDLSAINHKLISSKVKLGLLAKSDLYAIESTIASERLNILRAKNQLQDAQLTLIQLLNLDEENIFLHEESEFLVPKETPNTTNSVFSKAAQFLPSLKSSALNIKLAEKRLALSKANLYPSLSFSVGASTAYSQNRTDQLGAIIPFSEQLQANLSKSYSFSLHIPIFSKWANRSSLKTSKIEILKSKISLKQNEQSVYKQIQSILQKNKALKAEKTMQNKNLKAKKLAYQIAQKKYVKELIGIYELQQSKNDVTRAKIEYLEIQLKLKIQTKTLDFYKGISVFNIE